ncbi:hypothetical protein F2Q69_00036803 [Brassica cretica]|uniref:Uncharacterized protein n=1 Tax=Brassica cretica TaxID=69181 RepID=A0A8S9SR73_BRACR|nr:hypothetical protein F2Q69_00036803 [Brassica cretica]
MVVLLRDGDESLRHLLKKKLDDGGGKAWSCGGDASAAETEEEHGLVAVLAQGVPDPSSDVRDLRAAPARDIFLVRDSIRQLASDDQGVPDQATKDVCDPIEATRSIPARVPFVSSSRLNSFGGPIQQSSKVKR